MAVRKRRDPARLAGAVDLDALAPLDLHPAAVAAVGVLRAAADAVSVHPATRASFTHARALATSAAIEAHTTAAGGLLARTASAATTTPESVLAAADVAPF
jgi:hypothetical protein